jgi:hypothetical protein
MQVQRNAKKCKFQEEPSSYRPEVNNQMEPPPLPADPCPLLRPFCHQVSSFKWALEDELYLLIEFLCSCLN